jgi:thiol-disulfide isomerase/thioredoxin
MLPAAAFFATPAAADDPPATEPASPEAPETVEIPWVKDVEKAKAQAKAEHKHLLMDFTGSDWCIWCKRLEGEVFSHKEFLDEATKHYVFVFLDFPHSEARKAEVVDPKMNEHLRDEFGINGFPTVMLTTADGMPYARTGYKPGGPSAYLENLADLDKKGKAILALAEAGADGATKELLQAGFADMVDQGLLSYGPYNWILDKAKAVDADGSLGMRKEVERIEENNALQAALPHQRGEKPDWAKLGALILKSKYLSGRLYVNVGFGCAKWLLDDQKKPAEAKAMAQKIGNDPIFARVAQAKSALDGFIAECDKAIQAQAGGGDAEGGDADGADK